LEQNPGVSCASLVGGITIGPEVPDLELSAGEDVDESDQRVDVGRRQQSDEGGDDLASFKL
jgi:hypothetical protein